jgi:hypothetical protein
MFALNSDSELSKMPEAYPRARQLALWRNSVPITFGGHMQRKMPLFVLRLTGCRMASHQTLWSRAC